MLGCRLRHGVLDPLPHSEVPLRPATALVFLCALLVLPTGVGAQQRNSPDGPPVSETTLGLTVERDAPYFYRPGIDYGSAAQFNPLSVALTRGFSTLVWEGSERRIFSIDWSTGLGTTWDAVAHPVAAVERRGTWRNWFSTEFGPFSRDMWAWAFAPNWMGHTVAGGITYRGLAEWYEANGAPAPSVLAAATTMGAILINEGIENQLGGPGNAGTVADLYFFEPLGIALFSLDQVAYFFSHHFNAQDWSPQGSVTLPDLRVQNIGQVISYHIALPWVDRLDLLFLAGQGSQVGLLWDLDHEYSVGGAFGFVAANRLVDDTSRERLDARAGGGFYFVRNNSLLASLRLAKGTYTLADLNVYPGLLAGSLGELGGWLKVNKEREFSLGFTFRSVPGIGLGYDVLRSLDP